MCMIFFMLSKEFASYSRLLMMAKKKKEKKEESEREGGLKGDKKRGFVTQAESMKASIQSATIVN